MNICQECPKQNNCFVWWEKLDHYITTCPCVDCIINMRCSVFCIDKKELNLDIIQKHSFYDFVYNTEFRLNIITLIYILLNSN